MRPVQLGLHAKPWGKQATIVTVLTTDNSTAPPGPHFWTHTLYNQTERRDHRKSAPTPAHQRYTLASATRTEPEGSHAYTQGRDMVCTVGPKHMDCHTQCVGIAGTQSGPPPLPQPPLGTPTEPGQPGEEGETHCRSTPHPHHSQRVQGVGERHTASLPAPSPRSTLQGGRGRGCATLYRAAR